MEDLSLRQHPMSKAMEGLMGKERTCPNSCSHWSRVPFHRIALPKPPPPPPTSRHGPPGGEWPWCAFWPHCIHWKGFAVEESWGWGPPHLHHTRLCKPCAWNLAGCKFRGWVGRLPRDVGRVVSGVAFQWRFSRWGRRNFPTFWTSPPNPPLWLVHRTCLCPDTPPQRPATPPSSQAGPPPPPPSPQPLQKLQHRLLGFPPGHSRPDPIFELWQWNGCRKIWIWASFAAGIGAPGRLKPCTSCLLVKLWKKGWSSRR